MKTQEAPAAPVSPEVKKAAKAPVRARTRKAAAEAAPEAPAAAAPESEPVPTKAAKPAKVARGRKAAPAPANLEEVAAAAPPPEAPAAPAEIIDPATLVTDQARAVLLAIQEGRAVELIFADADTNPPRTFEPRQLIFDTFAKGWYVWGWDRRYNAERHHLLGLIAQVNPVEGMGRAAQGPYKDGTPANLVGGWLGGEPIHVKAVLLKQWIFAVRQAPAPFPDFTIEDLEEGKAQVGFTATDLRAITRWIMQFGDGVQVLEPQRLLDRVKQVGLAWGGKPAQAAAAPVQAPKPARPEHRPEHKSEHREHRAEHRAESRPEPRPESRPESRPEPAPERRTPDQPRHGRETHETTKPAKPTKFEIRIDRL